MTVLVKFVDSKRYEEIQKRDGGSDSHHEYSVSDFIFDGENALQHIVYQPATGKVVTNEIVVLDPKKA